MGSPPCLPLPAPLSLLDQFHRILLDIPQAEAPPSSKLEECASHEGAEEVTEQLRLLDLDAHVL